MGTKIVYSLFAVKNKNELRIEREEMDKEFIEHLNKYVIVANERGELKERECRDSDFEIESDCFKVFDAREKLFRIACVGAIYFEDSQFLYLNVHVGIDSRPITMFYNTRFARNIRLDIFVQQRIEKLKQIYLKNRKTAH